MMATHNSFRRDNRSEGRAMAMNTDLDDVLEQYVTDLVDSGLITRGTMCFEMACGLGTPATPGWPTSTPPFFVASQTRTRAALGQWTRCSTALKPSSRRKRRQNNLEGYPHRRSGGRP